MNDGFNIDGAIRLKLEKLTIDILKNIASIESGRAMSTSLFHILIN
jgi:hypothetical protein